MNSEKRRPKSARVGSPACDAKARSKRAKRTTLSELLSSLPALPPDALPDAIPDHPAGSIEMP